MANYAVFLVSKPKLSGSLATDIAIIGGLDARVIMDSLFSGSGQLTLPASQEEALAQKKQLELLGLELEVKTATNKTTFRQPVPRAQKPLKQDKNANSTVLPIKPIALVLVLALGLFFWQNSSSHPKYSDEMIAARAPIQKKLKKDNWVYNGVLIKPLATYDIDAIVLSKKNYRHDKGALISPFDLALGWSEMSNPDNLKNITISQSGRWYHLRWPQDVALSKPVIMNNSANTHIVPASKEIAKRLNKLKKFDHVHLRGYLIEANGKDGFRWRSSLSRKDRGNGACELFWVEEVLADGG